MAAKKQDKAGLDKVYLDQLTALAGDITKRIVTPEYAHMLDMWKAFLGGFVGPEMAKLDPASIDDKRRALMALYSKEAIQKMLNPEPKTVEVEKVVEKIVEKVVYKDRPVTVGAVTPAPVTGTDTGTGNRRYRPTVNKVSRKKREMRPSERANIIAKFNQTQALMDKDDDMCRQLVDEHNKALSSGEAKTYPAQVAGYWSWLCRVVLKTQAEQEKWFHAAVKKGVLPLGCPMPEASDEFKRLIIENQEKEQALAAHRQAYKTHMQGAPQPEDDQPSSIGF